MPVVNLKLSALWIVVMLIFLLGDVLRTKLVPRWLGTFLLAGILLAGVAFVLALFGLIDFLTPIGIGLQLPLILSELVLAIWLLAKGFNDSAVLSEPV